jgi:hypothetical protein
VRTPGARAHVLGDRRLLRERVRRVGGYSIKRSDLWVRLIFGIVTSVTALDQWFLPNAGRRPSREIVISAISDMVLEGILER